MAMEADIQTTPFVKQLADSDRQTREKAFSSLTTYLISNRTFTELDLLKIWKGLFFCLYHTAPPHASTRLSRSLGTLLLALPPQTFLPFLTAFFATLISYYPSLPAQRLDKYLHLTRLYISHSFIALARTGWDEAALREWCTALSHHGGVLDVDAQKVPLGLRYHVLDVWVDTLISTPDWRTGIERGIMAPVERVSEEGVGKVLRGRAGEVLSDARLKARGVEGGDGESSGEGSEDGFEGFD